MKFISCLVICFSFALISGFSLQNTYGQNAQKYDYAIVIHGGAGYFNFESLGAEGKQNYELALDSALQFGTEVLANGGKSIDAVEKVIRYLENNPMFNAGRGAVFTHDGKNELDASIMLGQDLNAGAVAGVTDIKNPISAARAIMENSKHVLLSREGASEFAKEQGLEMVDPKYFFTEKNYKRLQKALDAKKHGTVGCVALDMQGNLCAGTSTGGMTNKKYGRIGDSPIIGAGTYANNKTCGISSTGHGEFFIRYAVAYDISALMEYKGLSIVEAAEKVVLDKLVKAGGNGGIVGLDKKGNPAIVFNTTGMFHAYGNSEGKKVIGMFKE